MSVDGLGRVLQLAKQGVVYQNRTKVEGWNISGAVRYDAKSRTVAQGMNGFVAGTLLPPLGPLVRPTITEYDGIHRLTRVQYPVSEDTVYVYGEPGAPDNQAGRLVSRSDESGTVHYT